MTVARRELYAAVMTGGPHSPDRSEKASQLIDAFRVEVLAEDGAPERRGGQRSEYWLARNELVRRGDAAGIDEGVLDTLLYAFEAGVLRDFAETFSRSGRPDAAASMRRWAAGIRPRGWKGLLPAEAGGRS